MAKYKLGDKVSIRIKHTGSIQDGEITGVFENLGNEDYYWLTLPKNGILLVGDEDLHELNHLRTYTRDCECSSDKLGHPGHSDWCPKYGI